jgi:hypothetical protein
MARPRLELRRGARVRWQPAHAPQEREGKLVRPSPNGEEWLVENELGKFWIHVTRLQPAGT